MNTEKIAQAFAVIRCQMAEIKDQMAIIQRELKIGQMNIDDLDLSETIKSILADHGVMDLATLVEREPKFLLRYRNMGYKKVAEIIIALHKVGIDVHGDCSPRLVRTLRSMNVDLKAIGLGHYE